MTVFHHLTSCDTDRASLGTLINLITTRLKGDAFIEIELIGPAGGNPFVKVYSDRPTEVQEAIKEHYGDPKLEDDDMFSSWQVFKAGQRIQFCPAGMFNFTVGDVMWGTDSEVCLFLTESKSNYKLHVGNGVWKDERGIMCVISWLKE